MLQDHILIADDEPAIVTQLHNAFTTNGYATICASNGLTAWEELFRNAPESMAACVIDLQMPPGTFGGKDLVARIRRGYSKRLPIVIYSSRGTVSSSHEVAKAGADEFVDKEVGATQVVDIVAKLVAESRHEVLGPTQA